MEILARLRQFRRPIRQHRHGRDLAPVCRIADTWCEVDERPAAAVSREGKWPKENSAGVASRPDSGLG